MADTHTPRPTVGDTVVWVGGGADDYGDDFTAGKPYLIEEDDRDDLPFLLTDDTGLKYWVREADVAWPPQIEPPPKFQSLEEAEAWLDAHSGEAATDTDTEVSIGEFDPFDPTIPSVSGVQYVVTVSKVARPDQGTVTRRTVFRHSVNVIPNAPNPIATALESAKAENWDNPQPF